MCPMGHTLGYSTGHAPLRSLAEGNVFANTWGIVAARHRGAEEEFSGKDFFFYLPNSWVLKARLFALFG